MNQTSVMPLTADDSPAARKARVAELHDLWLVSGCSMAVMNMLLRQRHGGEQ